MASLASSALGGPVPSILMHPILGADNSLPGFRYSCRHLCLKLRTSAMVATLYKSMMIVLWYVVFVGGCACVTHGRRHATLPSFCDRHNRTRLVLVVHVLATGVSADVLAISGPASGISLLTPTPRYQERRSAPPKGNRPSARHCRGRPPLSADVSTLPD